jgi:hypothetical protein
VSFFVRLFFALRFEFGLLFGTQIFDRFVGVVRMYSYLLWAELHLKMKGHLYGQQLPGGLRCVFGRGKAGPALTLSLQVQYCSVTKKSKRLIGTSTR